MISAWIVVAILEIISIFLLCGKGSWLVAGYNTVFGFVVIVLCIGFCIFFDRLTKIKHKK